MADIASNIEDVADFGQGPPLVDVPLASPTTEAAMSQASSGVGSIGPGLGISAHADIQGGNLGVPPQAPPAPQPKPPTFTYMYDDSDTAMAELEEFFS